LLKSTSLNTFALDEVLDPLLDLERLRRVSFEEAIADGDMKSRSPSKDSIISM